MASANYELEHFYYGQLVREGKPDGELRLLASSSGVKSEHVAEAVKHALLPPLLGVPRGAWALVRGKQQVPFVLVQSALGDAGQSILHYVIAPPEMLRAMGGNLMALMRSVDDQLPVYTEPGKKLLPLVLPPAEAPSAEAQVDDILNLMSCTHNRIDTIEALLSAIVQGVPLVIQGAPPELETRVLFVQGLLALLPPSARFGVTFATHSLPTTKIDTQIRFLPDQMRLADALIYNWSDGTTSGSEVDDGYSRFITSQLRLDADLVIQQTRRLTAVAAWRIKRGDRLAGALGYAAYRFKIDEALLNNQPVESAEVSKVLAEDPTLPDELRVAYARHVLAFSLALGDMQPAEPAAILLRQHPDLDRALRIQFEDAVRDGRVALVYETLSRWLANPLGPMGMGWVDVTHRAAAAHMETLVKARDVRAVNKFLEEIHHASPGIQVSRVVPRLVELALPLSLTDEDLNLTVFLLAVNYLESEPLRQLIGSEKFTARLPLSLSRLTPYLTGSDPGLAPAGLLMGTANAFGDEWRDMVLLRLAEAAVRGRRPDLVDTSALAGLVHLLPAPLGLQYSQILGWIAKNVSTDEILPRLEDPGPTYLLQILLSTGAYSELAAEMLHQARLLYPGDKQADYVAVVRRIFAETPMNANQVPAALETITNSGIKAMPLTMAYIGALEGHEWSSALDPVAEAATRLLFENQEIIGVIQPGAMIALLEFHIKRKDVSNTIRVGGLLAQVATRAGSQGIGIVGRMYRLMNWDEKVKLAGLELLRRYVRQAKEEDARRAVNTFGREFGTSIQLTLEATFALRRMMGGVDLLSYAEFLHVAGDFLFDTAAAYSDPKRLPSLGSLMNDLDSMPGGLTDDDRRLISRELLGLGRAVVVLGDFQITNRPRDSKHTDNLLVGKADPVSALDVFWVMGGYLTRGRRYPLKLKPAAGVSTHTLGERSAPTLKEQVEIINGLLRSLIRAFPPDRRVSVSAAAIRSELESLWGDLPLAKRREIVRNLAINFQRVAELVVIITEQGSAKALDDNTLGRKLDESRQPPRTTLEFYRFVHGYFKQRTR